MSPGAAASPLSEAQARFIQSAVSVVVASSDPARVPSPARALGCRVSGDRRGSAMAAALGEPVRYVALSWRDYADLGFPGGWDMANLFHYRHDFNAGYCAEHPVDFTRRHPGVLSFAHWLSAHRSRLRYAQAA